MKFEDLSNISKKIFCPFLVVVTPIFWGMILRGYLRDRQNGIVYTNKGDFIFMFILTSATFIFSVRYCYYELNWFRKNKD